MDMAATLKEIESWPVEAQIELVGHVWNHLTDSGWQPELTKEEKAELERRIAAADANPQDVVTWESIVEYVHRKR